MTSVSTVLVLLSLVSACSDRSDAGRGLTRDERRTVESEVINRFHGMIKYAEAGELENILMYFAPSGPGTYVDGGIRHPSLEEMMVHYRGVWTVKSQDYGVPDTRVYVVNRDFALITSSSTLRTVNREGVEFQPRPWSVTMLWTRIDGEWFVHSFQQYEGELKPVEQGPAK